MRLWLSAAEIADLALPGLPAVRESVARLASREGWADHDRLARRREGAKGGGLEYHLDLLPAEARLAYLARHVGDALEAGAATAAAAPDPRPGLNARAALERDARLVLLGAFGSFKRTADLPVTTAISAFADLYNGGALQVPEWVRKSIPRLSGRTLARWIAARRDGAVDRLAVDRGAARRGRGPLDEGEDGAIKRKALGLIARQPHLSADHVRTILLDEFGEEIDLRGQRIPMPSVRALQKALKRWRTEHKAELLALTNPDAFKSRMRVSGSRAHLVTRLNELWEIDASPADVLCKDGRQSIYVCIDVYSRRIIAHVTPTPRSEAVGVLLRKALQAWGVPERIKTDNGSDFVSRASRRLLGDLAIEHDPSAPFSPEEKGVVERAIGTLQRDIMPLLPGFIGHSVADRKAIEGRRRFAERLGQSEDKAFTVDLSAGDLQGYLDRLIADRYSHRGHGGLQGRTPYQVAHAWSEPVRRIPDGEALALLLAPVAGKDGLRTVGKRGIRIDHSDYILAGVLPGETVYVRMDPSDLGRAYVFAQDGETFRGIAVAPELAGVDPAAAVAAAQAAQKAHIAERTAEIRAEARRIKPRDMVDAVARQAARAAGKLVELPRRAETHTTPALEAAEIARKRPVAQPSPVSKPNAGLLAAIEADLASTGQVARAEVTPLRPQETKQLRFRRYLDLEARWERGETISTDEAIWLGGYRNSAECKALVGLYADFGEAALR